MLKRKEDLFELEKDAVAAMLQGTHTFVDAKAYGQFQLYMKYKQTMPVGPPQIKEQRTAARYGQSLPSPCLQ
ncbi:hypothetical protein Pcinc_018007 [Petrolisthes cinctipes]|uniref:Uncharacterized protein n=1 Tax=Petrolisthes cinctipes TaxID=88211 RepID=A0AAE1FN37_PETCI|nr:hypothetical protein Pcinc_018007 [Petrolisthes cinctipes]